MAWALASGALYFFLAPFDFPKDVKEFLAAAISLGAVLTGFIATAKAILVTLPLTGVVTRLHESRYIFDLTNYLRAALVGCLVFSLVSLVGFFLITGERNPTVPHLFVSIWVASGVFAITSFYRVTNILFLLLPKVQADRKDGQ